MKVFFLLVFLTGCSGVATHEYTYNRWIGTNAFNRYIGTNENPIKPAKIGYIRAYKNNKHYLEYTFKYTTISNNTCEAVFKIRKNDHIIISWHLKGKKYDCLK